MELAVVHRPTRQYSRVEHSSSDLEQRQLDTPSPSLYKDSSMNVTPRKKKFTTMIIMVLPLAFQAAASIAIACIMLFPLDGSQFFLDHHPNVTLTDGTFIELEGYHISQSDITTLLSVSLVLLRWIAAAWAGPLCWRVICLLGESHGVRRRDIRWASSRGVLPPSTHFRHPLAFLLGIILLVSTVPQAFSPLLTGSIVWEPSFLHSNRIPELSQRIVNITGLGRREHSVIIDPVTKFNLPVSVASNYIAAWGTSNETHVAKRIVPSISGLNINSTLSNLTVPYLHLSVEWLQKMPRNMEKKLNATLYGDFNRTDRYKMLTQSAQLGYIWLSPEDPTNTTTELTSWYLVLRVGNETLCPMAQYGRWLPGNCFAMGRVIYNATCGYCIDCRVTSQSVVQNDTDLLPYGTDLSSLTTAEAIPGCISDLTPLAASLPSPTANPTLYVEMFLSRVYSALWNYYTDMTHKSAMSTLEGPPLTSAYNPSFLALRARVDTVRVITWLCIQLAATCAGLVFLHLQSRSKHPLIKDTSMIAFDMDSSDAQKRDWHNKSESTKLFRVESNVGGWKVVVVNG